MAAASNLRSPMIPGFSHEVKNFENFQKPPSALFEPVDFYNKVSYANLISNSNIFRSTNPPILNFSAYFDDRGEAPRDRMKFRTCHVLYFVEDDTIKVHEPEQRNAGFLQGCIISRNKIPKPEGGYYTIYDLNIGNELTFFGKKFKLLDCDAFTRHFMQEMGFKLGSPEKEIVDPVYADRFEMDRPRTQRQKPLAKDTRGQMFLKHFPKVLHFRAIYQRSPEHLEDKRYVSLYYNLTDGKMQITDENKLQYYKNQLLNGNFDNYVVLRYTLVPKTPTSFGIIGRKGGKTILNLRASNKGMRLEELMMKPQSNVTFDSGFLVDANPAIDDKDSVEYYTAEDLYLGKTIKVFGAKVFLYDCDEFTKEFYRSHLNRELIPVPLPDIKDSKYHKIVLPPTIGQKEDNLVTCQNLYSVTGTKRFLDLYALSSRMSKKGCFSADLLKFYMNCASGCDSKQLRFLSKIISNEPKKNVQHFIFRYFLEDDTVDITGLDLNFTLTGLPRGCFLRRMKLEKPSFSDSSAGSYYYTVADLYVGNVLYASQEPFLLIEADEYTYNFMECHSEMFIHSNTSDVVAQFKKELKEKSIFLQRSFEATDSNNTGFIAYHDFRRILWDHMDHHDDRSMPEQRIKTLARFYAHEEDIGLKLDDIISRIQAQLKRARFQDFEELKILFELYNDGNEIMKKYFKPGEVYDVLRSYPLPVDRDLLKGFAYKFPKVEEMIDHLKVVEALNYIKCPATPPDLEPYAININWERVEKKKNMEKINYICFLQKIRSELCPNC